MARELARSNRDLEQFAYVASHDLQEPLRAVTGFLGLLKTQCGGTLDKTSDEYIAVAVDGAKRMAELIHDLLAYSRVSTAASRPKAASCEEALERAAANLRLGISDSGAIISHDELPTVMADPTQLTQLLQNLIGNAIKFHRPGVAPEVHLGGRHDGAQWVLWVRDNGIGIPADQDDRIFKVFQRLHTRAKYPGTGIGLAICKKIVERHGGKIWVEPQIGEGTTFFFTLPAADGGAAADLLEAL
jgi:light-regulated signal transduction histidine kinase (bacteriophytochrome)